MIFLPTLGAADFLEEPMDFFCLPEIYLLLLVRVSLISITP